MSFPTSSPYVYAARPHRTLGYSGMTDFAGGEDDEDESLSGGDSSDYSEEEEDDDDEEEDDEEVEEEEEEDDDDEEPREDRELFELDDDLDVDLDQTLSDLNPSPSNLASGWISPSTTTVPTNTTISVTYHTRPNDVRPQLSSRGAGRIRNSQGEQQQQQQQLFSRTPSTERNRHGAVPDVRRSSVSPQFSSTPLRALVPAFVIDPHTSFLKAGKCFTGTQNLMSTAITVAGFGGHKEEWEVCVTINSVDLETGTIIGLMEALNVPATATTVVTYWEGEIIDFVNHTLWTGKWQADANIDLQHWRRFDAFKGMDDRTIKHGFRSARHIHQKYIFMRWKERFFVNMTAQDSGLTIAGFYYVCIRRSDGHIEGFYFDPSSTPYQKLVLRPRNEGHGVSFSDYSFA